MQDLAVLWQSAKDFLNSNFFTSIAGACAGAFAGAIAAQRIVTRGKEREEVLTEIRNTNAATVVALSICNTFLAIKKQHIKRLKETFDKEKAAYLDRAEKYRMGQLEKDTVPSLFFFDLQVLMLPPFELPLDTLRHQIFEKLSLDDRRPLMLLTSLSETVHGLNTSVNNRNRLIASYQAAGLSSDELLPLYFGLPQGGNTRVINQQYPALIDAIHRQTNDGIFYSKLLCDDLFVHNTRLAERFRKRFRNGAPGTIDKPDFTTPAGEGLMPDDADYADWFALFTKGQSSNPRRKSISRVFSTVCHRARSRIIAMRARCSRGRGGA